jgi:Ca-activated chloride channel family protein
VTCRFPLALWLSIAPLFADSGVLLPAGQQQPDASVFSLDEMRIRVVIDNGDAQVDIRQIFGSHSDRITEGDYVFALPARAMVSDFAVWDDLTRIPGVILERKRAEEIYENLKQQTIDPGLLQQGEGEPGEARRSNLFSAHIVPVPPFGTKRVEIQYHQSMPVERFRSEFAVPLRPDAYRGVRAGLLHIDFELRSREPVRDFKVAGRAFPLRIAEQSANRVRASWDASDVEFTEDFTVQWELDRGQAGALDVLAYRDPATVEPGFFQASTLLRESAGDTAPRSVVALFDTSLSMQWEKLERAFRALESLLHALRPVDRFNLLLFNTEVTPFAPAPVGADPAAIEKALAFVRSSRLRGGTDLEAALLKALAQPSAAGTSPYIVLIGDAGATRGTVQNGKLAARYEAAWKRIDAARRPRTFIFAVGDDANLPLVRMLARSDGVFEWVRSTEPIDFKLSAFLGKLGQRAVEGLSLAAEPANFSLIYPLQDVAFPGSVAQWVGRYRQPGAATFAVAGAKTQVTLPAQDSDHPQLPRTWAKARVDALLEKIERDGEDRASIDEIIRLSRKYKFVTPYTSFLAAPRALLRPRVIRPGDPVIRIKTDPSIESVVALFPFGLTKPLRYLKEEDVWQARFLAPPDMADGTYSVRLILRDGQGHVYRESKTFEILSKPPLVRIELAKQRYRAGERLPLRVKASRSARTIVARMYGASPVELHWDARAGASTGEMTVPRVAPGKYRLNVMAEDVAHNIGTQEVTLEVLP